MPSILDYFENPQFLASVVGGGGGGMSFDQPKAPVSSVIGQGWGGVNPQPPEPPPPPPPQIMAQAPMGMNPQQFNNRFTGGGPEMDPGGPGPGAIGGPVPMPQPNPFAAPPPMPRPKPMDMAPQPQKFEGGIFGGMGFKPDGWDDMTPPNSPVPGKGNPPPMVPEVDPAGPGNAMAFTGNQTKNGATYVDPPGLGLGRGGPLDATSDPAGFTRAKHEGVFGNQATPDRTGDELTINRTPRNGTSLDDDQLARPTPAGNPMDIRSPAQGGPDPRIARARQFGNFLQGLGKGLSAPTRPGAGKGAAFIAGAGGALQGYGEHEDKNLARDERGLDRGEKRREADQTHDYRNRTLDSNKDYHNKLIEQHSLDRGERTSRADADRDERTLRHDADRDERSGRSNWKMIGTENGKPVFSNLRNPNEKVVGQDKLDEKLAAGRGGGARDFQFDHKYNAYLAVHKDDHQGALDYANGHKKMSAAEANAAALKLAQDDLKEERRTNPGKFNKMSDDQKKKYLDDLAEDNRKRLRGERAYTQPSARDPDKNLPGQTPTAPPAPGAGAPQVRQPPPLAPASPPPVSAAPKIPPRPAHLPPGSQYSPSLGIWRSPDEIPPNYPR